MKYLVQTTEVYRVDTEDEAKALIEASKNSKDYVLNKYTSQQKENKKAEEEWVKVTLTKCFCEEKEPYGNLMPFYCDPDGEF